MKNTWTTFGWWFCTGTHNEWASGSQIDKPPCHNARARLSCNESPQQGIGIGTHRRLYTKTHMWIPEVLTYRSHKHLAFELCGLFSLNGHLPLIICVVCPRQRPWTITLLQLNWKIQVSCYTSSTFSSQLFTLLFTWGHKPSRAAPQSCLSTRSWSTFSLIYIVK